MDYQRTASPATSGVPLPRSRPVGASVPTVRSPASNAPQGATVTPPTSAAPQNAYQPPAGAPGGSAGYLQSPQAPQTATTENNSGYGGQDYHHRVAQIESNNNTNLWDRGNSNRGLYQFNPEDERRLGITNWRSREQHDRALDREVADHAAVQESDGARSNRC